MGKGSAGPIMAIVVLIVAIAFAGYIGHWYSVNNDCVSCKLGVGGECGTIGSCNGTCNMEEVTLCWIPVCKETIAEE